MLRGIHPLMTPDLLHALASMGHGDRIAIVDANFPAATHARRLVRMPNTRADGVFGAILQLLPIDDFEPDAAVVMQVVGKPEEVPEVVAQFGEILAREGAKSPTPVERHAFYARASEAFVIVQTGERRLYGNIIVTKGVIRTNESRSKSASPTEDASG